MKLQAREYKRVLLGALVIDAAYLLAGGIFSFLSLRAAGGLLLGTAAAVINALLLEWTITSLPGRDEVSGKRFYVRSYLGRMLFYGLVLAAGFQWLEPFATVLPLFAPKVSYLFLALTRKEVN